MLCKEIKIREMIKNVLCVIFDLTKYKQRSVKALVNSIIKLLNKIPSEKMLSVPKREIGSAKPNPINTKNSKLVNAADDTFLRSDMANWLVSFLRLT